jgi:ornithine--oxo-acid transaminase
MISKLRIQALNNPIKSIIRAQSAASAATSKTSEKNTIGAKSEKIFAREDKYGAHNYHPLPVAIAKGKG